VDWKRHSSVRRDLHSLQQLLMLDYLYVSSKRCPSGPQKKFASGVEFRHVDHADLVKSTVLGSPSQEYPFRTDYHLILGKDWVISLVSPSFGLTSSVFSCLDSVFAGDMNYI
jgi:hypothetical protein